MERSVAFYRHLGFGVEEVAKYRDRLSWASLRSEEAEIMLEGTYGPSDPDHQRVQFYLYSHGLAALRDQLLAAGIAAGPIEDGSPGPREQMRVTDPDGRACPWSVRGALEDLGRGDRYPDRLVALR